jgi:hypothetical protein
MLAFELASTKGVFAFTTASAHHPRLRIMAAATSPRGKKILSDKAPL